MTASTTSAVLARHEVPRAEQWNLESVFATEEEWELAFVAAEARFPELLAFQGELSTSAATLLTALRLADEIDEAVERVTVFAMLRQSEDATNPKTSALMARGLGLSARAGAAAAFLSPELAALPGETVTAFFRNEPGLVPFRHAVDRIQRQRAHICSVEVEEVLARSREVAATAPTVHGVLEDGDLPLGTIEDEGGDRVTLAQGNLSRYLRSPDRRVRQEAWERSADAYLAFQHTFAAALAGGVKNDVFYARSRNYPSSLEASLAEDNVPPEVFHNLLDTVWKNFPVWHRYFRVRRRLLGLGDGDLHGYDLEAPLGSAPPAVGWDDGVARIVRAVAPLGPDYVATVRRGIDDRWVDRAANIGKGGGAFSWGSFGTAPFISMTYQDDLGSVSTLAHELGHSLHSYLTWETQPVTYARYGMSAAETASNLNQALLGAHLLETETDRDWTLAILEERMANHLRYLFTMPILARFELDCHERVERGEALTAEGMSATLLEYYSDGYGDEVVIDEPRMGITWARFAHLFMNFYVFQYAVGISAAAALAARIREDGPDAAERYLTFLRTGGSRYPLDALRDAGIDMASPEPVQNAFDFLAGYVDRLEALVE